MKSYNSGLAVGLLAERAPENQWSPTFSTPTFGLKVTARENDEREIQEERERLGKDGDESSAKPME